ncbi:unnamed protein product [Adineta steineri]|uniref:Mo25-like protein n=1 Tax=Adineta steineri TaxID=433720 RepID=A0A818N5J9_9BILA|nr:unnamed protein product [Adineta steineri]CAF3731930.1 unnamed protein product [Adineta steineri]
MPFSSLLAPRSKTDHAKQLRDYFTVIENEQDKEKKNYEDAIKNIHKTLLALKDGLFGPRDGSSEPAISDVSQLCSGIYTQDLMTIMINNLSRVTFEDRKEIVAIFNNLLRRQVGTKFPAVDHIIQRPGILFKLIEGYENADIALNCGMMLRECVRVQELAEIILRSPDFYKFFDYVQKSTFDIASDAFATFKDLLTKHKPLCADFLERNYDHFFNKYRDLLNSENYVTRRQSLKIFVANPTKPKAISDILLRNREKLIDFLTTFHTDRTDDEQFNDEKAYLIKQISELKDTKA